tara:strand:- start:84 stop:803 length:720 start_codon:yes stop_codon:yes gene_type:complete
MRIQTIRCLKDNFCYLVIDEKNLNAIVIDPGESGPVEKEIKSQKLKLKYVLNTHHHTDHVGGNIELKNKFKCHVIGFHKDKNQIPGVDILVKNKEKWIKDNFEFEVFHTPGHTKNHVCFYFKKIDALFTGDTLFSLGCGRIFEGTYEEMYNSLKIIKSFPAKTMIYFGHEYTGQNLKFCELHDKENLNLRIMIHKTEAKLNEGLDTTPTRLSDEIDCNIFLKTNTLVKFSKLRQLKDNF